MKKRMVMLLITISLVCNSTLVVGAKSLEERITELEQRVAELEAMVGISSTEEVVEEEETEEETEIVMKTTEEFINDMVEAFNTRQKVSEKYTNSQINTMTSAELVEYCLSTAEAEREFYDKYLYAEFEDLNIQYLCKQYITGLEKQYELKEIWDKTSNFDQSYESYESGYYNRAYVIVELAEYYDAPFDADAVTSMKSRTDLMDSLDEAEKRNALIPSETVKEVQQLLHDIGFKCWNIDGVAGKRTVKAIKRFQEMYGFEVDGMIDDELIQQLKDVKAEKDK